MERVLIAGCGYVGCRLAVTLAADGVPVWGLRRNPAGLPDGVEAVAADVSDPGSLRGLPDGLDALVYAVSPSGRSEAEYRTAYVDGLRNTLEALEATPPERVLLVSSTGVYGQRDGRWVDEQTRPEPADATGAIVLEGEALVEDWDGPGITLRLGGIYGPGRERTVRRVLDGEAACPPPDRYGNRIHRDDAAGAIHHLLTLPDPAGLYLGVDREPAALRDVYRWIAERAGAPDPCRGRASEDGESAGRRGTNKRCSSQRLLESGFRFRYPTFREGYAPFIDALG
jgi:nucleoside-diphosphate-sugar epimerase